MNSIVTSEELKKFLHATTNHQCLKCGDGNFIINGTETGELAIITNQLSNSDARLVTYCVACSTCGFIEYYSKSIIDNKIIAKASKDNV